MIVDVQVDVDVDVDVDERLPAPARRIDRARYLFYSFGPF